MMKKVGLLVAFMAMVWALEAQVKRTPYLAQEDSPDWVQLIYGENPNVREVMEAYESYYDSHEFVKNNHTQYYKRWMRERLGRTDQEGNMLKENYAQADKAWEMQKLQKSLPPGSPWEEMGPWQYDHETAMSFEVQSPGAAHVYTVEQAPSNPQVVYAGTATAGLWRSTDKGMNWSLLTKDLYVGTVYAIAIDPNNADIVYFGEGDGSIWKSTDGGQNWAETGNAAFQANNHWVRDLRISATDGNDLWAATDLGFFRTTDGGQNWILIEAGEWMEIEFKPNDANTMYAVKLSGNSTEFYRSTDGGINFSNTAVGWPTTAAGEEQRRCEITVTPANPNLIYVQATGSKESFGGLWGIYKSTDAGLNFTFECCGDGPVGAPNATDNPNTMGWSEDGSGEGGQYYYDLAMAVSPTDQDLVFGAGINMWRSEDGGSNWSLNAHWVTWVSQQTKDRYTHADVHDIKFFETADGVDMWIASDGGLYYSSNQGDNTEPRMYGIHGTDFWGFQSGFQDGSIMLGGTYHNGTIIKNGDMYSHGKDDIESGGWLAEGGGDNYRGFVNLGDNDIVYSDQGRFRMSEDRSVRWSNLGFNGDYRCNTSYVSGRYGNYEWDPRCYNHFYSPVENSIYKTEDGGVSFDLVKTFEGAEKVIQIKVASSDPNRMYCTVENSYWDHTLYTSADGGANWTEINPSSGITGNNSWRAKYLDVDPQNPTLIWVALLGGQTSNKVFRSANAGGSWSNITGASNLGNKDVQSIHHQIGTNEGLYLGTRHGVYYKNANMADWEAFSTDLPAKTTASFLQAFYGEQKIRTASQRGVFQADFYENSQPLARIAADRLSFNVSSICALEPIQFVDHSIAQVDENTTWEWTFEGGAPAVSSERNPMVTYDEPGSFDVTLTVTDIHGTSTITMEDFMTIDASIASFPIQEDFEGSFPPEGWKLYNPETASWQHDWVNGQEEDNKVMAFHNYWTDASGKDAYCILPAVDFTQAVDPSLSFDYLYRLWGTGDSLAVKYRLAGDPTWQTLWQKGGSELNTPGTSQWWWDSSSPNINWASETIDMSLFEGMSCVEIAIANIGANGNHIWVDNVNLDSDPKVEFEADNLAPCTDDIVVLSDLSSMNPDAWSWTFSPSTVSFQNGTNANSQNPEVTFDVLGSYEIGLVASYAGEDITETKSDYIVADLCNGCFGDLDNDNDIDISDFVTLVGQYGCNVPGCSADFDDNGVVDVQDLLNFLEVVGNTCP